MSTSTTTTRSQAQQVYRFVVNNWAVSAEEIAQGTGLERPHVNQLLRQLKAHSNLVEGTHVNGERELTWQSYFDIENEQMVPQRAGRAFKAAWPVDEPERTNGNTGSDTPRPRYTEDQLAKARAAKAQGLTRKQVAEAAGIRSPNYLAKLLKREAEAAAKAAKPKRVRKPRSQKAA